MLLVATKLFLIFLVILISILVEYIFSISGILGDGQKQISKDKIITTIGKGKQINNNNDDDNNSATTTNSKPIENNNDMQYDPNIINNGNDNIDKVIILTFGDTEKSQFTTAKPILNQFGFKASFFITCSYVDLNNLSSAALNHEVGGSKQCLEAHGIKPPNIFAVKYGNAWNI
jgi:hypothetical protein